MKQLLKKIAAIGTSALIVGISAGAAVAANYPNPFISGDVAVVYGADSIDTVQAMNINLDLASRGGTSDSGSSVVGDAWQVKTSSDKFEIGESIYDVEKYIDDDSLPLLAAGEIVNSKGTATYDQYLYFSDVSSSMINYTEDDDVDLVGDYFFIANGHNIAKYTLDFNTNLESDITSGTLDDIEDEVISILGKDYTITTATNGSGGVELTLMSGAETATITSGEELPPLGGYTISAVVSSSTAVQFTVDGKTIDKMNKGEIEPIPGTNDYIAVTDISYESYSGGLHQATFWIGADKLLLRNTQDLEVNAETINGATVTINHTESGGDISITEIVVNLTAQDDYLVPVNGKLSAEISTEGDEPQILIGQNWDIELTRNRHHYLDAVFYFGRIDQDEQNYWKCLCDSMNGIAYIDDNYILTRTNAVYYDSKNPRIELVLNPTEYIGIFDNEECLNNFESNCKNCMRYSRNCSILKKSKEGRIQEEIQNFICSEFKVKKVKKIAA